VRATIGSLVTVNGWALEAVALDRESIVPIYRQLYERLREQILTGALPEGTRLPPERALAERLGVNRSTVVRGYRELAADGLIEQKVGSGSRVATLKAGQPERASGVPWWVTLPPWRVGQYPAVLGELAASEHGRSRSCKACRRPSRRRSPTWPPRSRGSAAT
jgi:DNA-binding transcriptional MocR family regulator